MNKEYYQSHKSEISAKAKEYREKNKASIAQKKREYHLMNRDRDLERSKRWYQENKELCISREKARYEENKEKHHEQGKRWVENNPQKRLESVRKYNRKYRATSKGNLSSTISKRMNESLRRGMKAGRHWEELVGYTVDQLMTHIERLFKPGMTWENYGTAWHIDHKIPIAVFNFQKPTDIDFHICWSLKNLQPLEATENIRKQAKIEQPFQPSLAIGMR